MLSSNVTMLSHWNGNKNGTGFAAKKKGVMSLLFKAWESDIKFIYGMQIIIIKREKLRIKLNFFLNY